MSATTLLIAVFGLAAAVGLGWLAVEGINRRPIAGAFALFGWLAALTLFIDTPEVFVWNIGGINVVAADVICAFLALIAGLRLLRGFVHISKPLAVPLIIFIAMLGLSYARGLPAFGLQHATNEFREFFYFLAALGFVLSFPFERLGEKLLLVGVVGGATLAAVALIRLPMMGGITMDARPVPSYSALVIGQGFFTGWFWLKTGRRLKLWRWLIFALLPFSFLMLHRSVWMALAGGLAAVLAWDRAGRGGLLKTLVIGGVVGAVLIGLVAGDKIMLALDQAVEEATSSEESTFIWRLEGWEALLRQESGWNFVDLAIGRPMGSGYARTLGNSVVNTAEIESGVIPHNYYLSMLLRGGVVGLVAFVGLYLKLGKILRRAAVRSTPSVYPAAFLTLLVTQMIYYVPYSADFIQGLFLGGAVMLANSLTQPHEARS